MRAKSRRRRLLFAITWFSVVLPAGWAAAACPSPLPPGTPTAFTGSAGAHPSRCAAPRPKCTRLRDSRGRRGSTGKTGALGRTGAAGRDGSSGPTGAQGNPGAAGSAGAQGIPGLQGVQGVIGAQGGIGDTGSAGAQGIQGLQGVQGVVGAQGDIGVSGSTGADGAQGVQGDIGVQGSAGANGATGDTGADGATGPDGATGADGAVGPAGTNGLAEYGYIYNLGAQSLALEAPVTFDRNGVSTAGITHALGGAAITLVHAGTYKVAYSVSAVEPNQMALFVNGTPVPGSIYGSGAGTQQNTGQAIITVSDGAVLTLNNHTSAAAVTLQTLAGGTRANANASIAIEKLG